MAEERPNIRIEIQNNLIESMDVDEGPKENDGEEGEIRDDNEVDENDAEIMSKQYSHRVCSVLKNMFMYVYFNIILDMAESSWRFYNRYKHF